MDIETLANLLAADYDGGATEGTLLDKLADLSMTHQIARDVRSAMMQSNKRDGDFLELFISRNRTTAERS